VVSSLASSVRSSQRAAIPEELNPVPRKLTYAFPFVASASENRTSETVERSSVSENGEPILNS